jgi:arylsulfatase A-like enzyme
MRAARLVRAGLLGLAMLAATTVATAGQTSLVSAQEAPPESRPNVVLILTDDMTASDLETMPNVHRLLVEKGTTFENHTVTLPTCCPSRVSYLRGQYPHNHKIGYGVPAGEQAFRNRGYASSTVGTWANAEGYRTAWIGKYLNGFDDPGYVPPGWDRFHANVNKDVWSREFASNGRLRKLPKGSIDTHLGRQGEAFLRNDNETPMLLVQNFNAPHQNSDGPPPAPKSDLRKFSAKVPRTPAFNERDVSDKPGWVQNRPLLQSPKIREMGLEHRGRLASLQVVDRQVGAILGALADKGELDETYVMLTTDNGYHMGEHRLEQGKMTGYKTDVEVPLVVRGPGVQENTVKGAMVQNIDFAPTVADLAGHETPEFVDGRSMVPLFGDGQAAWRGHSHFEGPGRHPFVGTAKPDGTTFIRQESGFEELYLPGDPHQLRNVAGEDQHASAQGEMEAALQAAHACSGGNCP